MSEKIFNTRIQLKHDTEINWAKALNFIPKAGEVIIYDADENYNYARLKIGDGITPINSLGFFTAGSESIITNKEIDQICFGTLESNSWEKIKELSESGIAKNIWSVGDCKSVHLQGTMGTLELDQTLYLYILGFDHNAENEGYGITFGGFKTAAGSDGIDICLVDSQYGDFSANGTKYFNMNHWGNYNYGGWARCDLRYDILGSTNVAPQGYGAKATKGQVGYDATETCATSPVANTLMSCLPADLRAVMKPITKYTDNVGGENSIEANITAMIDYLPLLAEFEVLGTCTKANSFEQNYQMQYEYFANGNSRVKYQHSMTNSSVLWWVRSPYYNYLSYYCGINSIGDGSGGPSDRSYGIAPILLV